MKPPEASPFSEMKNLLEAAAFGVGLDLAGDAGVVDGGHEDQEAAGQGDVRGDACALLGDGLLGDLAEDLLTGLEQVRDGGEVGALHGLAGVAAATGIARVTGLTTAVAGGS